MLYACRLRGYEEDWRRPTRELRAFYHNLPEGDYCFEVKAIDRDLNQSQPAQLQVKVIADPYTAGLAAALSTDAIGDFVGDSTALRHTRTQLAQVAPTRETVLILGETGPGKGLAARAVHSLSPRKDGPFIQVNCGAIPRDLIESELFGHERGAFTVAVSRKMGKKELVIRGDPMLRITTHTKSDGTTELKLAGRLGSEEIELLTCELQRLGERVPVILDLQEVEFINGTALSQLQQWTGVPLVLQGGSVFIRRLLAERGL
ncbi:MAG: sigma 54-interacting transcriptional regulator [Candidatus Latescibacterota bacterium]|jgi:hypothetical protein